jgi:predicted lipoprotein with Yx(FWY)xxD motif
VGIRSRYVFLAGIAALSLVAAACSSSAKTSSPPASSAPAGAAQSSSSSSSGGVVTIETKTGAMGTYLTNGNGKSLYMFASDTSSKSSCTGQCLTYWPPVTGTATASGGANASLLGSITGTNGTQVTYAGHPLYTFAEDNSPGDTKGQGSTNFGAKWWLVAPSGQAIEGSSAGASSSSSSSSSGGGGGWS